MSLAENAEQGLASLVIFLLAVVSGQFFPPQGLPWERKHLAYAGGGQDGRAPRPSEGWLFRVSSVKQ